MKMSEVFGHNVRFLRVLWRERLPSLLRRLHAISIGLRRPSHYGKWFAAAPPRCIGVVNSHARCAYCGIGRSLMIIHEVPNLSRSMLKRAAKKVSCMGMKIWPPSASRA